MIAITAQAEIQEVWKQFKADPSNIDLRNRLVEQYMPLVRFIADRIWQRLPDCAELDDLISAGVFGLIDAINSFDLSRGIKFETYCVLRIRGAMLDELREMDWVPRLVRIKAGKLDKARKQLETRYGRLPADWELAEHLQISIEEFEVMLAESSAVNVLSLNRKWYETDSFKDVREVDILTDRRGEDPTQRAKSSETLRSFTKGLNRTERLIVILYYYEELTMKEIGATLDLSESRVSQLHSSIIGRMESAARMAKEANSGRSA